MNKTTAPHSSLTYITEERDDRPPALEHKYLGGLTYCVNVEYEIARRRRCQKKWPCFRSLGEKKEDF